MRFLTRFLREEDGPTVVEYAVLLAGIVALCIASIVSVGGQASNYWSNNQQSIDKAINNAQGS
jgi:pilus assembly protein Flp/PilA